MQRGLWLVGWLDSWEWRQQDKDVSQSAHVWNMMIRPALFFWLTLIIVTSISSCPIFCLLSRLWSPPPPEGRVRLCSWNVPEKQKPGARRHEKSSEETLLTSHRIDRSIVHITILIRADEHLTNVDFFFFFQIFDFLFLSSPAVRRRLFMSYWRLLSRRFIIWWIHSSM